MHNAYGGKWLLFTGFGGKWLLFTVFGGSGYCLWCLGESDQNPFPPRRNSRAFAAEKTTLSRARADVSKRAGSVPLSG